MNAGRRAWRWLRREALTLCITLPALICVLGLQGIYWRLGIRGEPTLDLFGALMLSVCVALFAVVRALHNLPYVHPGYRAWLATTPWTVDEPLPFGRIELDWPDVIVLGGFIAVNGMIPGHHSAKILALFLFFHNLALIPTIYGVANHVPAYASLFGLGLMVKLWPLPWASALTGAIVYAIVYDGLWIKLRKFPEPGDEMTTSALSSFDPATAECGWPYDQILRQPEGERDRPNSVAELAAVRLDRVATEVGGGLIDHLAWSLLLGWWVACAGPLAFPGARYPDFLAATAAILALGGGLIRLAIYTTSYRPPISFRGRVLTLRWIIPGYDVVLLGPLLAVAIPAAIFSAGLWRQTPWEILGPTAIATTLFIVLAAPPGLRRWRLIGTHRMVSGQPMPRGGKV